LTFIVIVDAFEFVYIDVFPQDLINNVAAGPVVSAFEVDGPDQGFQRISQHGATKAGIIVLVQHHIEPHLIADLIEGFPLHDLGSHFSQEALVAVGILFKEVFRYNGSQYGISQILEALVILDGIRALRIGRFVGKGEDKNTQVDRGESQQRPELSREIPIRRKVVVI
jgi:hypothetical protein